MHAHRQPGNSSGKKRSRKGPKTGSATSCRSSARRWVASASSKANSSPVERVARYATRGSAATTSSPRGPSPGVQRHPRSHFHPQITFLHHKCSLSPKQLSIVLLRHPAQGAWNLFHSGLLSRHDIHHPPKMRIGANALTHGGKKGSLPACQRHPIREQTAA